MPGQARRAAAAGHVPAAVPADAPPAPRDGARGATRRLLVVITSTTTHSSVLLVDKTRYVRKYHHRIHDWNIIYHVMAIVSVFCEYTATIPNRESFRLRFKLKIVTYSIDRFKK